MRTDSTEAPSALSRHQDGLFGEDFVRSLQGLEEGVELGGLRILRIGTGVNLRRLGVNLAPDLLLHLAVSVGLDFVQVALALACDAADLSSPSERKRCAIWSRSLIMRW